MRILATIILLLGLLCLTACGLGKEGMIVLVEDGWKANIYATNKDGFGAPDGILWRQGKFYFADEGSGAIESWCSPDGLKTLCNTSLGIMSPEDLVMDHQGNIFFTDDDAGGVWEIDATGKAFLLAGKEQGLVSTEGIALAPSGNIIVGDGEKHLVYSVSRSGVVSTLLAGIKKPESMVYDERGNLFIADNEENVLYMADPELKLYRLIEHKEGFSPETIFYQQGTLYITNSQTGKLYRYTPQDGLHTIAVFGGRLGNVQGITADDQGSLYLSVQSDLQHKVGYIIKLEKEIRS